MSYTLPSNTATSNASPEWLNTGDTSWQLTASTLVGLQSVPGLIILYGCMVKKKWAINSAFMALYAFAAALLTWVLLAHQLSFGTAWFERFPIVSCPGTTLSVGYLLGKSDYGMFSNATYVFFQFMFAAITVILLAGSVLGRMNFLAWMMFVPLWVIMSYTVGAYSIWGESGWLKQMGLMDFAGGYVIHLSSGVAGFTAAYWVGPRVAQDRQKFPPNNIIHMLGGAGFLWLGWSGFNGGAAGSANLTTSLAVLNTHLCTATSLFVWQSLDMVVYKKSSVIGAVQGMITGLVCITPAAGLVEPVAAMVMGCLSGSIPWYTMMVLHKRTSFFQRVDDTLGVFHTHAVAGALGGLLAGFLANPKLVDLLYIYNKSHTQYGLAYSIWNPDRFLHKGLRQVGVQLLGAVFITAWNVLATSFICVAISRVVPLRMDDDDLNVGDDAVHGEEAYAIWGDGGKGGRTSMTPKLPDCCLGCFKRGS